MYKKNICKKVRVINNAVDCESFAYNQSIRNEYRKLFGIKDNEILIGHVGRFMFQKNHEYLINIFNEFHINQKALMYPQKIISGKLIIYFI